MTSKIVLTLFFILTTFNFAISSESKDQKPAKARIEVISLSLHVPLPYTHNLIAFVRAALDAR